MEVEVDQKRRTRGHASGLHSGQSLWQLRWARPSRECYTLNPVQRNCIKRIHFTYRGAQLLATASEKEEKINYSFFYYNKNVAICNYVYLCIKQY